ncbi:MAG: hypothetical protein EAX96_15830 [Candidatus Lokiarchaeota archaeon]|nr:hypothetical protein [Candidatus Lokiarchaeota archaeon]
MVHPITQIFSTALIMEISIFFLFSKKRKISLFAMICSAPLGWIFEIVSISIGLWTYSISQLVPIFGLPLPIWFGWVFVTWYGALIITNSIDFINNEKLMKDKTENQRILYTWLFSSLMYMGPVLWGILFTMPWFFLFNAVSQNSIFLNGFTWNIFDYFGLDIFQYIFWLSLILIGTFFLSFFLVKIRNLKENKFKFYGGILISAAVLTPLGWGIEFFGVNSHTPIWSYTQNHPLLLIGPYNVPIIVYIGWFFILMINSLVIFLKAKHDIFSNNEA